MFENYFFAGGRQIGNKKDECFCTHECLQIDHALMNNHWFSIGIRLGTSKKIDNNSTFDFEFVLQFAFGKRTAQMDMTKF